MTDQPDMYQVLPGEVSKLKIRAWTCDHCLDTHVIFYLKCEPPEGVTDEPFYAAIEMREEAARGILRDLPHELEYPAHGIDGGIEIPVEAF